MDQWSDWTVAAAPDHARVSLNSKLAGWDGGQKGRGARVVKIPYTIVRGGHRYFQPRGRMCLLGVRPMPLGPEGEEARRRAQELHKRWIAVGDGPAGADDPSAGAKRTKEQVSAARSYPRGSIGAAWQEWVRFDEWKRLAPSTRNKIWWEAWTKRIEPVFAHAHPDIVSFQDIPVWRGKIESASGLDPAHKALKVWRSFWRVMVSMRYTQLSDPSARVVNKAPPPRN